MNNYGKIYVTAMLLVRSGLCLYKSQNLEDNGYQMRVIKLKWDFLQRKVSN